MKKNLRSRKQKHSEHFEVKKTSNKKVKIEEKVVLPQVKFFNNISKKATSLFEKFGIKEGNPDIIVVRSENLHNYPNLGEAMAVGRSGIGTDNIPIDKIPLVPVFFAPGANADSVAEFTVGKIICAAKRTYESVTFVKNSKDPQSVIEKYKKKFKGQELKSSSVFIFGLGNIGVRVAYRLMNLGMKVFVKEIMLKKNTPEDAAERLKFCNGIEAQKLIEMIEGKSKKVKVADSFKMEEVEDGDICISSNESCLYECDFVTPHMGFYGKPLFSEEFFKKCKKGITVINCDRGQLSDEKAVLNALKNNIVSSYHTDFAPNDFELRNHEKCFATPHLAASTDAAEEHCGIVVSRSILDFVFNGNIQNSKNFPWIKLERRGDNRLVVFGKLLAEDKLLDYFKKNDIQVIQKGIASNKSVTYCIFDVSDKVSTKIQNEIDSKFDCKCKFLTKFEKFDEIFKEKEEKMILNFNAGPAILPSFVVDNLSSDIKEFANSGMSVAEMSHRDKPIMDMIKETTSLIRESLEVPENYNILILQGGATTQFSMVPMNLSSKGDKIGYIEQGAWSKKAIADAKICDSLGLSGKPVVIASNSSNEFRRLPEIKDVPQDLKYLHICQNETIHGLEYRKIPDTGKVPLVLDASSNIFSLPMDWKKNIGMIYAGAQKNSGIAGATIVIIRKDLVNKDKVLPNYLKYINHITGESEYNTPPVVAILSINYMLKWLKKQGGVKEIEKANIEKAETLYKFMNESNGFYIPRVELPENQSRMNVVFNMKTPELEEEFIAFAKKNNLIGIKGHRSLGGMRASIYNGFPLKKVVQLIEFMKEFQKSKERNS